MTKPVKSSTAAVARRGRCYRGGGSGEADNGLLLSWLNQVNPRQLRVAKVHQAFITWDPSSRHSKVTITVDVELSPSSSLPSSSPVPSCGPGG
jgi:hypothetical protein